MCGRCPSCELENITIGGVTDDDLASGLAGQRPTLCLLLDTDHEETAVAERLKDRSADATSASRDDDATHQGRQPCPKGAEMPVASLQLGNERSEESFSPTHLISELGCLSS